MKDVYATRRMFALWLPFIVMGMAVYIGSYAHSLTFNGLSLLGVTVTGLGVLAAALDTEDDES